MYTTDSSSTTVALVGGAGSRKVWDDDNELLSDDSAASPLTMSPLPPLTLSPSLPPRTIVVPQRRRSSCMDDMDHDGDDDILQAQYILVAHECFMEYKRTNSLSLHLLSNNNSNNRNHASIVQSMVDQVLFGGGSGGDRYPFWGQQQQQVDEDRFNACLARYGLKLAAVPHTTAAQAALSSDHGVVRRIDLIRL